MALLVGAQLVNLVGVALVARLYTPAAFGAFAVLFAIASVVGGASSLRLDVAATTARNADAAVLFRLAARSNTAVALGTGLVAVTCYAFLDRLDGQGFVECLALAAVTAAIAASATLTYARVRQGRYRRVAGGKLLTAAVQTIALLLAGVVLPQPTGLLLASALGYGAGALALARGDRPGHGSAHPTARDVLGRHRGFVLASAPAGLISALAVNLPVLATGTLLGSTAAGDLALALRIGALPSALFGQALMPILFGEIAHRLRAAPSGVLRAYDRALLGLLASGAVSVTGLALSTWWLAPMLFGPQWRGAGVALLLLVPYMVSQFAVSPLSQSLNAAGRNGQQLCWDLGRLAMTVAVFAAVAVGWLGPLACLISLSAAMVATYAVHVVLTRAALGSAARAAGTPTSGETVPVRSDATHAHV
ncbi:lipopolysaccharide biosynthesis protein [Micromonospora deserti]|nr:oligosaccharide flippase family protein [Micromonospora deserti]